MRWTRTDASKSNVWYASTPDFSGNLYESVIRLDFLRFIRPEKTFPDLEALKEQIGKDLKEVRIPLTQP